MFSARSLDGNRTARWSLSAIIALGAHAALALGAVAMPHRPATAVAVTEIELVAPKAPEPATSAPAPEPDKTDEPKQASHAESAEPRATQNSAPAARAGNVLTAKSDAPTPAGADPVDFVTDPNGSTYGSGVVARGGTADHGTGGATRPAPSSAKSSAPVARTAAKSDIVPASDLSRTPALSTGTNCAGYYPRNADADSALVTLIVVVGPDGGIAALSVAGEAPAGQGFGAAARACIGNGHFRPALDKTGRAVKSATRVRVTFTR